MAKLINCAYCGKEITKTGSVFHKDMKNHLEWYSCLKCFGRSFKEKLEIIPSLVKQVGYQTKLEESE